MSVLRYQDIFVPGGFPLHTYNPREELQLEQRLLETKQNLCKLVTVTGHTKSGKTVLANKVFPRENAIWIDGGLVSTEEDLWRNVIEQLGLFESTETEVSSESTATVGGKGSAEANFFIAKGTGEVSTEIEKGRGSSTRKVRSGSPLIIATQGLRDNKIPLIIDDFHYISKEVQGHIVRALKPLIFEGVPVLIIAIPHRRYDAMKVERK